jgi:hypothetical protein
MTRAMEWTRGAGLPLAFGVIGKLIPLHRLGHKQMGVNELLLTWFKAMEIVNA